MRDIAVDGGQTGLRLAVVDAGQVTGVVEAAGFSYRPSSDGVADDVRALAAAIAALGVDVGRISLGLTNAPHPGADRDRLGCGLAAAVGAAEVLVTSDMVTAHCGALGEREGVVVAAGTGAVCLGVTAAGWERSDGFGYLLGDDGSGFAIGRAGVRAALRARERRGPQTALLAAVDRHFADVPDFPHGVYRRPHPVAEIAAFAREVAVAAEAGDAVATAIWSDAADALVTSVLSVVARCPGLTGAEPIAVSYTGRLFDAAGLLRDPFVERLTRACPRATVVAPAGDALAGAVRLLGAPAGRYRDLVSRARAERSR